MLEVLSTRHDSVSCVSLNDCDLMPVSVLPAVFLDVSQKGRLLDTAACIQRYPAMTYILQDQQQHVQQHASSMNSSRSCGAVAVWANMARTMVMAHQRRGESDLVAHWLYQLLALDTAAEEWHHAMQQ